MMNNAEIFRKIGGIISELTEQYQYLSENFENMNELELELFVANSNFLTDHAEILKKLNKSDKPASIDVVPEESSPIVQLGGIEAENSGLEELAGEELKFDFENKSLEELYSRKFSEEEQEIISRKLAHSAVIEDKEVLEEETTVLPPVNQSVVEVEAENLSQTASPGETHAEVNSVPTLNEVISSQRNPNTVSSSLTQQPISDLKTSISLNDKLLFVKELFNGYSLAYSEAIEILNRFDSFEAAESFLNTNYAVKNDWSASPSTVEKFYEILHRRYAK